MARYLSAMTRRLSELHERASDAIERSIKETTRRNSNAQPPNLQIAGDGGVGTEPGSESDRNRNCSEEQQRVRVLIEMRDTLEALDDLLDKLSGMQGQHRRKDRTLADVAKEEEVAAKIHQLTRQLWVQANSYNGKEWKVRHRGKAGCQISSDS